MKFTCPHCGEKTFSPLQKALCGNMTTLGKPCPACGRTCVNGKASLIIHIVLSVIGLGAVLFAYFTWMTPSDLLWRGIVPFAATIVLRFVLDMFVGELIPTVKRQ